MPVSFNSSVGAAFTPEIHTPAQPDSVKLPTPGVLTDSIAAVANANEQLNMLTYSYGLTNNLNDTFSRFLPFEN